MSSIEIAYGSSSPILVMGMHRSGTRLVADVLHRLGIFMGADQQADAESITFMLLNETILHQCGAFWSEPMAAHFLLSQPEAVAQLASLTADSLNRHVDRYRGSLGESTNGAANRSDRFGWKDPRNTFTLPVWRHLFPGLKAIHIIRHGVDVAASLYKRHAAALHSAAGESVPSALTVVRDDVLGILSSRRGWTLTEALTMWEQYVEKARLESADLGRNVFEIRYEALVQEPDDVIANIARFCEVEDSIDRAEFCRRLQPDRCFGYRKNPELAAFAESQRAILERYGYSP